MSEHLTASHLAGLFQLLECRSGARSDVLEGSVREVLQFLARRLEVGVGVGAVDERGGTLALSLAHRRNPPGSSDKLEVDLNFMLRVPLWPIATLDSKQLGPAVAREIAVVDRHELAAGKLAALVARKASRDIFDARELLRRTDLDRDKLRLAFIVYGGLNRKDWRTVRLEDVAADPAELKRELVPMLRAEVRPKDAVLVTWAEALVRETRALMSAVLPLEAHEVEFVERLNSTGAIAPELLTSDPAMQATIREQPGLQWKAMNVKKQFGGAPPSMMG